MIKDKLSRSCDVLRLFRKMDLRLTLPEGRSEISY